jgi:hypothetical protein
VGSIVTSPKTALFPFRRPDLMMPRPPNPPRFRTRVEEAPTHRNSLTVLPAVPGAAVVAARKAREKARPRDKSYSRTYLTLDLRRPMDHFTN